MKLSYLYYELTKNCNHRCLHCFNDSNSSMSNELNTYEAVQLISNFKRQGGEKLQLTGGEPLTRPDFSEILKNVNKLNFNHVTLSTNGLLFDDKIAAKISNKVTEIDISLDGYEEEHNNIRGIKCWQQSVDAIKRAVQTGIDVFVCTSVTRPILHKLPEFIEFLVDLGVGSVKFAEIGDIGRKNLPENLKLHGFSKQEIYELLNILSIKYHRQISIRQSLSMTPIKPTIEVDGLIADPTGFLFPMISLYAPYWIVGKCIPNWIIDENKINEYINSTEKILVEGIKKIVEGEPVNWWILMYHYLSKSDKKDY